MTIRSLEIFVGVCRYMNMSKAAENMMISQSSVSQAISSLEKEYQVRLFERLNHSLYLTAAGKEMLYLATQVLKNIELLDTKMSDSSFQNTLNLGVCSTIGSCLIHPLLEYYKNLHQEASVIVEMNNSKNLEKKILSAKLDLAIVQRTKPSPYLEYLPVLEDELVVICWKEHPLAGHEVELQDLKDELFIRREKGSGTELLIQNAFSSFGIPIKTGWVCNSIATVKEAVLHKAGIAVLSKYLVPKNVEQNKLSFIKITNYDFTRQFDLIFHKDKIHDVCFQNFVNACVSLGKDGMQDLILNTDKFCIPD